MTTKIIGRSYTSMLTGIALSIGILLLGVNMFRSGDRIVGVLFPIIALISIFMFLKGLMDNQPRVTMDQEGITATEFQGIKILWSDIEKINVVSFPRSGRIITFKLFDEEKYTLQLTKKQKSGQSINRIFGITPFAIMAEGLDMHPSLICDEIIRRSNRIIL